MVHCIFVFHWKNILFKSGQNKQGIEVRISQYMPRDKANKSAKRTKKRPTENIMVLNVSLILKVSGNHKVQKICFSEITKFGLRQMVNISLQLLQLKQLIQKKFTYNFVIGLIFYGWSNGRIMIILNNG